MVEESINRKLKVAIANDHFCKRKESSVQMPLNFASLPNLYRVLRTRDLAEPKESSESLDIFATAFSYNIENIEVRKNLQSSHATLRTPLLEEKLQAAHEEDSGDEDDEFDVDKEGQSVGQQVLSGDTTNGQESTGSTSVEEFPDLFETYQPNLKDSSVINLNQLLHHPLVKNRPFFCDAILRLLDYKSKEESVNVTEINSSLSEIIHHISPYMSEQERANCSLYLKKSMIRDQYLKFQADEERNQITEQEKKVLHSLFSFFDKDKSGTVNLRELVEVVRQTNINSRNKSDFDLLSIVPSARKKRSIINQSSSQSIIDRNAKSGGGEDSASVGSASSNGPKIKAPSITENLSYQHSIIDEAMLQGMIDSIDRDFNNELDFEEFFVLFSSTMR